MIASLKVDVKTYSITLCYSTTERRENKTGLMAGVMLEQRAADNKLVKVVPLSLWMLWPPRPCIPILVTMITMLYLGNTPELLLVVHRKLYAGNPQHT